MEKHHTHHELEAPTSTSFGTMVLFQMFGMSSWWAGNAIFAQLPMLVTKLPERDALGSQLSMMVQAGNMFSIGYKIIEHHRGSINVDAVIHGMNQVSLYVLMLLALFWDHTVNGHSLILFALAVLAGGIGCLSDLTYWSVVMRHPPPCTKAVGIGMSTGNFFILGISVVQVGGRTPDNPRFSVATFFVIAAFIQLIWGCIALQISDELVPALSRVAGLVSTKLSDRVLALSPMRDKAVALLRADPGSPTSNKDPEGSNEQNEEPGEEHPGPNSTGLPSGAAITLFEGLNFLIYGATYTMPSLLPFVAGAFPEQTTELLLRMMIFQSIGDVIGRSLAPSAKSSALRKKLPLVGGLVLPACFAVFVAGTCNTTMVSSLGYDVAICLLPLLVFLFYFSRGMLITAMFLQARSLTTSREAAEHLASTMGFCGQMGALSANIITFTIVSLYT